MIENIVKEFNKGVDLIETLDDSIYLKTEDGAGSVGSHFRHNLDFASNFLRGLESGKIDYNTRERDLRVETNREYARERMLFLIKRLRDVSRDSFSETVLVASEIEDGVWHKSSVARELEFLHSHTVHHYALLAEKLKALGVKLDCEFGVAPSTLKFWAEEKTVSKVA